MTTAIGNIEAYQSVASQTMGLAQRVTQAVKQASANSGVEFSYLLKNAETESSLNPTAKAKTSSATGLFQFVEQTWLRMVKTYGEKYGLADAAGRISIGSDGVARVTDRTAKKEILALRKDPEVSACMAAELTNENKEALTSKVGGKIGRTELYLAHFLGSGGAANFISAMRANPNAKAADVLPTAASANASVFYDKNGQPKTLSQVYQRFAQKFEHSTSGATATQMASASSTKMNKLASAQSATSSEYSAPLSFSSSLTDPLKTDMTMSSAFATMMIAQMDMDSISSLAGLSKADSSKDDETRKRSVYPMSGIIG